MNKNHLQILIDSNSEIYKSTDSLYVFQMLKDYIIDNLKHLTMDLSYLKTSNNLYVRHNVCMNISWALLDDNNLKSISEFVENDIVYDLGCGHAFWSDVLNKLYNVKVKCVDINHKYRYDYVDLKAPYRKIKYVNYKSNMIKCLKIWKPKCLMFIWPTYNDNWAYLYTKNVKPEKIIYIGESEFGCTADQKFHEYIGNNYQIENILINPIWDGIYDKVYLLKKTS